MRGGLGGRDEREGGRITLGAFGFFVIHGEFAVGGEEVGIVVVDVGVVGDGVVFFDELFNGWVGDGVGQVGELGRHDWWIDMYLRRLRNKSFLCLTIADAY